MRPARWLATLTLVCASLLVLPRPGGAPASGSPVMESRADSRPDILVLMVDDMRVDDLRFMPAVRRLLVRQGVSFRNSFAPYPLCCPSRASFLTGQDAHNHGVYSHLPPYGFAAFHDSYTLATALHRSGYETGMVGKYLNGFGVQRSVESGERWTYVPPGWTHWQASVEQTEGSPATGGTYRYFDTSYDVDGHVENGHAGEYQTATIGRKVRGLVSAFSRRPAPWFVWASFVAPHHGLPVEPDDPPLHLTASDGQRVEILTPARPDAVKGRFDSAVPRAPGLPAHGPAEDDVRDKPRSLQHAEPTPRIRRALREVTRQRAETLAVVDREVRTTMSLLRRSGALRHTVVVFTSDNGVTLGEHRLGEGKGTLYEPSTRVPLIVRGPGIPRGRSRFDPVTNTDLTATIAALAHVRRPLDAHLLPDGSSRLGVLRHGDRGWVSPVLLETVLGRVGVSPKNSRAGFGDERDQIGLRTARYLYLKTARGHVELYDLDRDPNELHSVAGAAAYADVRRELDAAWWRYKDCAGDSCRAALPVDLQRDPAELARRTRAQLQAMGARSGTTW